MSDCPAVTSWNGDGSNNSIWGCKIYLTCGSGGNCYFKLKTVNSNDLNYLSTSTDLPSSTEVVDPSFKRGIILSDDSSTYTTQKTVTVIVNWNDFAGPHESRLTTILRKL